MKKPSLTLKLKKAERIVRALSNLNAAVGFIDRSETLRLVAVAQKYFKAKGHLEGGSEDDMGDR